MPPERWLVTHHYQFPTGAGNGDIQTSQIAEKTDIRLLVGAHKRYQNDFLFPSLKPVYGFYLQTLNISNFILK
jgi:hypothetical protein